MINFDKFLASFIEAVKAYRPTTVGAIPFFIKKALEDQGLEYKDGEIVKTQRRVSAEAKEAGYGESEDERIRKALIEYFNEQCDMSDWNGVYGYQVVAWLEKQGKQENKVNSYKITFEDVLALECAMKTAKITKGGDELYEILVPLYNKIHNAYLAEKQGERKETLCDKCRKKQPSHSCQDITELGRCALEKQDEQKPSNVQPKFGIGWWITSNDVHNDFRICKIVGVDVINKCYTIESTDGNKGFNSFEIFDNNYHEWSIEDAKDGDVLCCESGWTCIFKALDSAISFSSYCFMDNTGWFCETGSESHTLEKAFIKAYNGNIYPAAKEQRDILFQKMHEEGYEWNAEKKEVMKIVTPIFNISDRIRYKGHACDCVITEITDTDYICGDTKLPISTQDKLELVEQKPTWSEEDDLMLECVLNKIGDLGTGVMCKGWLKSLKNRIKGE